MRIELAREIEERLRSALRKAGRREIGGMLFAEQLAPSHFRIMDFSIDADSGSHATFRRDPQSHGKTLEEFFRRTDRDFTRFNYLGEWHSHPSFAVQPSAEDLVAMTDIVESRHSVITFAILFIVRLRWRLWLDHSLTVFARGQSPRQTRIRHRVTFI
jgi:integrative and conjugative element protein (TIGR02256 family)